MATVSEIKEQRDRVSAAIDAWEITAQQASADATAAASAGAQATAAQQAADASAALSASKKAEAQVEAQKLADLFSEAPSGKKAARGTS